MANQIECVFAGLAGRPVEASFFELGEGVTITQTFAHVMAPLMVAFSPAPPGSHHPAPWKKVSGGFGFDILSEIKIPTAVALTYNDDPYVALWCITALIRLRNGPGLTIPAITTMSFSEVQYTSDDVVIWPFDVVNNIELPVSSKIKMPVNS